MSHWFHWAFSKYGSKPLLPIVAICDLKKQALMSCCGNLTAIVGMAFLPLVGMNLLHPPIYLKDTLNYPKERGDMATWGEVTNHRGAALANLGTLSPLLAFFLFHCALLLHCGEKACCLLLGQIRILVFSGGESSYPELSLFSPTSHCSV